MGRPLNKKYFGNRNIGTGGAQITGNNSNNENYADDRIGGSSIGSISWSNVGSFMPTAGVPLSGLALPAPTIPGGTQATWTVSYGAAAVTTGAGSVGLVVGETYEYAPIPGLLVTVATSTNDGTNATFTVTTAGSTTTVLTDLQTVNLTKSAGMTGVATFAVDISLKIAGIVINEKGSGYTGAETFTVTLANGASGTVPAGTIVLNADSGAVGSATNQENAIIIHARIDIEGAVQTGDIIRQVASRRYKVKTSNGISVCKLVDNDSPGGNEAYIKATDANGNTYFVTKLTAHRVRLTQWTNNEADWIFGNGATAPWTFDSTANGHVIVENA